MNEENKNSLLIVDDEAPNLLFLSRVLGSDYTIYSAKNGESAIEKAKKNLPDLILLDIVMPEMDGYEVLTVLKKDNETKDIPVIFVTGLSSSEDEERGLSYDAADYISKPFNPQIVKLRVRNQMHIINLIRTIKHLSMTDQLTGLPNRRSFDERLRIEWGRALRDGSPISILFIDMDKFKSYNDAYGHQQGDEALRAVASAFSHSLKRATDFAARWGGEEFAVLLPNTEVDGAMEVAESIRAYVENTPVPLSNGKETRITISIGLNARLPTESATDDYISVDDFIRDADDALYTAKHKGRNRIFQCGALNGSI